MAKTPLPRRATLWLVHGNLQTPAVWHPLIPPLLSRGIEVRCVDLAATLANSLPEWGRAFCAVVRATASSLPQILLGYSLGGRLALHALLEDPSLWACAVLVSADTGLAEEEKRRDRLATDETWARRFLHEPFDDVLADWNRQPVFQGGKSLLASENVQKMTYSREVIALIFRLYSKGLQADLLPALLLHPLPVTLWIAGEQDPSFARIALHVAGQLPRAKASIVPDSAHRVPWEAPEVFVRLIDTCIDGLIHPNRVHP